MIKCKYCGNQAPEGLTNCPYCQQPFAEQQPGGSPTSYKGNTGQDGLPAWLESLRVDERAVPGSDGQSGSFVASDLIDNDSLPNWMRSQSREMIDRGTSDQMSGWKPNATPSPNPDKGFSAGSLIDEKALPTWMQEGKNASAEPERNISASSLVQPDALPNWMSSLGAQPGPTPAARPDNAMRSEPQLPPHLQNLQQGQGFSSQPMLPPFQGAPSQPLQPQAPLERGFSANSLIDSKALPTWMGGAQSSEAQPPEANTQNGLSASSLLDVESLPSWMRESNQGQSGNQPQGSAFPSKPDIMGQAGQGPQSGNRLMPASSLLDVNALPDWMREANPQGGSFPSSGQAGFGGNQYSAGSVQTPRVPSRPRVEGNVPEQSEAAANAFASMLGVASGNPPIGNSPQSGFGQQSNQQQGWMQSSPSPMPQEQQGWMQSGPLQGYQSGTMPGGGSIGNNGTIPGSQPGMSGIPQPQGYPPMPGNGTMPGYQPGMSGISNPQQGYQPGMLGSQSGYSGFPGSGPTSTGNLPNMGSSSGFGQQLPANQQGSSETGQTKKVKRGFLETIRSWFPR